LKKLLIISPYFAPSNAPDTQRIRMSLPYFRTFDWEVEIVACHPKYYETNTDELLLESIPNDIKVHYVNALDKSYTSKLGLGSLALRSLWFYKKKVNQILKQKKFDLIYFSTTQFPVCVLGNYWKKKFEIPFVIDLQDPWHTEYYQSKPKNERPPKYWFSYRLNKYLERIAFKKIDGIIAVTQQYIDQIFIRYTHLNNIPNSEITFSHSEIDYHLSQKLPLPLLPKNKPILSYMGVLGPMMKNSLVSFFETVAQIPNFQEDYLVYLKGTSYVGGTNLKQIGLEIAKSYGLNNIQEDPLRVSMLEVLNTLSTVNGLIIFGTDEPNYTASKIYPYVQSRKPILAILHQNSSAFKILNEITNATVIPINATKEIILKKILIFLQQVRSNEKLIVNEEEFEKFSAKYMTKKQTELFQQVLNKNDWKN